MSFWVCPTAHSRFSFQLEFKPEFEPEFKPEFEPIKRHTWSSLSTWRVVSCYSCDIALNLYRIINRSIHTILLKVNNTIPTDHLGCVIYHVCGHPAKNALQKTLNPMLVFIFFSNHRFITGHDIYLSMCITSAREVNNKVKEVTPHFVCSKIKVPHILVECCICDMTYYCSIWCSPWVPLSKVSRQNLL